MKQCSRKEQSKKCALSLTAKHKYTEIQWEIQFLLNTLKLEVQVIDALIAQLSMCPFLHLQGEPLVNVPWTVSMLSVCSCAQRERERETKKKEEAGRSKNVISGYTPKHIRYTYNWQLTSECHHFWYTYEVKIISIIAIFYTVLLSLLTINTRL